ncbi:unnamed protein product [Taenia asiatica]|uniref:Retrotransposon hot spot (RHS) protein n=1 Tax=Taenia asiatica TaxID=60517 RepID=A0A0R3VWB5_TAEAS|nr:unnamed protein product [Taenia asiatica]
MPDPPTGMRCTDIHVGPRRMRWQGMLCLLPLYPLLDLYLRRFGGANVVALNCKESGKGSNVEEAEYHLRGLEKLNQVGRSVPFTAMDCWNGRSRVVCAELGGVGCIYTGNACFSFLSSFQLLPWFNPVCVGFDSSS